MSRNRGFWVTGRIHAPPPLIYDPRQLWPPLKRPLKSEKDKADARSSQ